MSKYVFYVNVGNLPRERIEEHLRTLKEKTIKELDLGAGDRLLMIGVNKEPTRLELLEFT